MPAEFTLSSEKLEETDGYLGRLGCTLILDFSIRINPIAWVARSDAPIVK